MTNVAHILPDRCKSGRSQRLRLNLAQIMLKPFDLLAAWQERIAERRSLMELSDATLKDIGISRTDTWREANKPFWLL
jgi:uncharacterized protein YjiS (DUF1127 family)